MWTGVTVLVLSVCSVTWAETRVTRVRSRVSDQRTRAHSADDVTEHFARTRPGTVPRLPASLFLDEAESQE